MAHSLKDGGVESPKTTRVTVTVILVITFVYIVILNALAGAGTAPFTNNTGSVSDAFYTCVTPADYTFSIWGVIYFCLAAIVLYAVVILIRKVNGEDSWEQGGALSMPFLLVFIVNLHLNVTWLFAWDALNATGSMILLLLVAITNALALRLSMYSFSKVAGDLYENSKIDFWAGVAVINGYGIYERWTILASIINLNIFFDYEIGAETNAGCLGSFIAVLLALIINFILQATLFVYQSNPLITDNMVVLWAMVGIYTSQKDIASHEVVSLIITNIAVASFLIVARIAFLIYKNRDNALYGANYSARSS